MSIFKKLNKMFKMHFFLKPDFTFYKTDSIIGLIIVFCKKVEKKYFYFSKNVIWTFLFFDTVCFKVCHFYFLFSKNSNKNPYKMENKIKIFQK
jgi:hypothetical protein